MIVLLEIGISMLLLFSAEKIGELYTGSLLEIHLYDGAIFNVKIDRNSSYACPINCGSIHHHTAVVEKNGNSLKYTINYLGNNIPLKLNNYDIEIMYEIKKKNKRNKKNRIRKTEIDLQSFIKRYDL